MIKEEKDNKEISKDLNDICDECKNKDESVSQNLILTGFKICKSCRVSKRFSQSKYYLLATYPFCSLQMK